MAVLPWKPLAQSISSAFHPIAAEPLANDVNAYDTSGSKQNGSGGDASSSSSSSSSSRRRRRRRRFGCEVWVAVQERFGCCGAKLSPFFAQLNEQLRDLSCIELAPDSPSTANTTTYSFPSYSSSEAAAGDSASSSCWSRGAAAPLVSSIGEGFPQRVFCWRTPDCTAPIHEKGAVIFPLVASRGGGGATSSSATISSSSASPRQRAERRLPRYAAAARRRRRGRA